MNIVVCVKQVPDVSDIKWTKENNLDRSSMLSQINQQDEWALDYAASIKNKFKNVNVIAISMGPLQAKEVLNYAIAKCATRAILLSDKLFSASDTLITSKILARAITKYVPDFNIILTGQMASDGDTAQVPVSLAQYLDVIDVGNVIKIANADKNSACVYQKVDNETNVVNVSTPCLISVKELSEENNIPKIEDYIRAQDTPIEIYNCQDLDFQKEEVGIIASPTMVQKAYRPSNEREAVEIKEDFVSKILEAINTEKGKE